MHGRKTCAALLTCLLSRGEQTMKNFTAYPHNESFKVPGRS